MDRFQLHTNLKLLYIKMHYKQNEKKHEVLGKTVRCVINIFTSLLINISYNSMEKHEEPNR